MDKTVSAVKPSLRIKRWWKFIGYDPEKVLCIRRYRTVSLQTSPSGLATFALYSAIIMHHYASQEFTFRAHNRYCIYRIDGIRIP